MGDASNLQTSFLGGEWSQSYQGRADNPRYSTAMNLCLNAHPIEEGAAVRRSGDRFVATTRSGAKGRSIDFAFSQSQPFSMIFTDGHLQFIAGNSGLVMTPDPQGILAISTATPAVVHTAGAHGWSSGDFVQVRAHDPARGGNMGILRNRQFIMTSTGTNTLSLADAITGAPIDGSTINFDPLDATSQIGRVLDIVTPYTAGSWANINAVQFLNGTVPSIVLLHPTIQSQVLAAGFNPLAPLSPDFTGQFGIFTLTPSNFQDGPYLDPVPGSQATPSAKTGIITFTIFYTAYSSGTTYGTGQYVTSSGIDYISLVDGNVANTPASSPAFWQRAGAGSAVGPNGFQSTDVGRLIRMYSTPPAWAIGTAYSVNDVVTYNGAFYIAIAAQTGKQPDAYLNDWLPSPASAVWSWGRITSVTSATVANVLILGPALLYTSTISTWRLGAYSNSTTWPSCGTFHEGRLWLGGAIGNRFDGSQSNDPFNMAPTGPDGTVADNNGITYTFNAEDINQIFWMAPDHLGIMCGTQGGEWLIQASQLNDPLTPTSIQAHRSTKNVCANTPARRANLGLIVVQGARRKLLEFMSDAFTGRFAARNLSEAAKHLTKSLIEEIAYVQELVPIIWARCGDGSLIGCTYKRESAFSSEAPTFFGWHRHKLGSGRVVESISSGPSVDGNLDTLCMVTNDPATNIRHVTYMGNVFQETDDIYHAAFVDDSVAPASAVLTGSFGAETGVQYFGLWHLNGKTVSVFAAGLDLGDFLVTNGSITVPFTTSFTKAILLSLTATGEDFGSLDIFVNQVNNVAGSYGALGNPGTIQSYEAGAVGYQSVGGIADWDQGLFYAFLNGANTSGGVSRYSIATGTLQQEATSLAIFGNTTDQVTTTSIFTGDGMILTCGDPIHKINPATLTVTGGSFDVDNTTSSGLTSVQSPADETKIAPVTAGANHFYVSTRNLLVSSNCETVVFNTDAMSFAGFTHTPSGFSGAQVVEGQRGTAWGCAYASYTASTTTNPTVLKRITILDGAAQWNPTLKGWTTSNQNPFISVETVATINPTDIDATWTNIIDCSMNFDQTDGNVILLFLTSDSVTTKGYILKVNSVSGVVMWKTAVAAVAAGNLALPVRARIRNSQTVFLDGRSSNGFIYFVNTATGAMLHSNVTVPSCPGALPQIYDDTTGGFICDTSLNTSTSGHPVPQNSTPTLFTHHYANLQLGAAMPGAVPTITTVPLVFPTAIGFTFTTQCQILRPLAPQASGAQNGPALGKTRRNHMGSFLFSQTQGVQIGVDFTTVRAAQFKTKGENAYTVSQLFSGVHWATLEAGYDFDNMICWQVLRPYPAIVSAVGGFLHTQDR